MRARASRAAGVERKRARRRSSRATCARWRIAEVRPQFPERRAHAWLADTEQEAGSARIACLLEGD